MSVCFYRFIFIQTSEELYILIHSMWGRVKQRLSTCFCLCTCLDFWWWICSRANPYVNNCEKGYVRCVCLSLRVAFTFKMCLLDARVEPYVYAQWVCASVLYTCMRVHWYVCVISSVFGPLKGSCGAEGEEKITGADIICFCHVGLASGLTHCGPVRHGRQVDVPAHMLQHGARTYPTHTDTHTRLCRDNLRAYRAW